MSRNLIVEEIESKYLKSEICDFSVGDTIKVTTKIIEGSKERLQAFTGTVIARKGAGINESFSLHRVVYGSGMEKLFLLHSPRIVSIEVMRRGKVRRSKLYYLRGTSGKKARVKERILKRK